MSAEKFVTKLRKSVEKRRLKDKILIEAIVGLEDKQKIRNYVDAYTKLVKENLQKEIDTGEINRIDAGRKDRRDLEEVAKLLVIDKIAYLLNDYRDSSIYYRWNDAIPELYTKNKTLQNILGFF